MNMHVMKTSVTSADFVRRFGEWQDRAATRPIYVTHHGRDRLVMLSIPQFEQLSERAAQGDRPFVPTDVRLGAVFERIAHGFLAIDRHMVVTEINAAACSYLKIARDAAIGSELTRPFPSLQRTLLFTHLTRAIQSGETGRFEQSSQAFDGRWMLFETMPYLDGAACLFRDVTDDVVMRREAEAEAATAIALETHGRIGRARLSPRGTFTHIDRTLATMAGFEPEALARARFTDILPLARRVQAAHEIEAVLAGGEAVCFTTALLVNRGGERPVRVGAAELRGEHGGEGAILVVTPE